MCLVSQGDWIGNVMGVLGAGGSDWDGLIWMGAWGRQGVGWVGCDGCLGNQG